MLNLEVISVYSLSVEKEIDLQPESRIFKKKKKKKNLIWIGNQKKRDATASLHPGQQQWAGSSYHSYAPSNGVHRAGGPMLIML